jgi:predicted nucleotidyltransferase
VPDNFFVPDNLFIKPEHLAQIKAILRRYAPRAEAWAYGSRVKGGAHEASDLDIVLRMPDGAAMTQEDFSELKNAFSDSDIPFLVDVRDWAGLPGGTGSNGFRQEILKAYVVVQSPGME